MSSPSPRTTSRPADPGEERPAKRTRVEDTAVAAIPPVAEPAIVGDEEPEDEEIIDATNIASGSDLYLDTVCSSQQERSQTLTHSSD